MVVVVFTLDMRRGLILPREESGTVCCLLGRRWLVSAGYMAARYQVVNTPIRHYVRVGASSGLQQVPF